MLEKYLIEHCAPTLASLKTASLFSYHAAQDPEDDVKHLNRIFRDKGVELLIFYKREGKCGCSFMCAAARTLQKSLERPAAKELLGSRYGYHRPTSVRRRDRAAAHCGLQAEDRFPHEMCLFLRLPVGRERAWFIDQRRGRTPGKFAADVGKGVTGNECDGQRRTLLRGIRSGRGHLQAFVAGRQYVVLQLTVACLII